MKLACFDCAAAALAGLGIGACAKHATPEERAAFERHLTEIANRDHPTLAAIRGRKP